MPFLKWHLPIATILWTTCYLLAISRSTIGSQIPQASRDSVGKFEQSVKTWGVVQLQSLLMQNMCGEHFSEIYPIGSWIQCCWVELIQALTALAIRSIEWAILTNKVRSSLHSNGDWLPAKLRRWEELNPTEESPIGCWLYLTDDSTRIGLGIKLERPSSALMNS